MQAARVRALPGSVREAEFQGTLQCGVARFFHGEDNGPLQDLRLASHLRAARLRVDGHDGHAVLERKHDPMKPRCHDGIHACQQGFDFPGIPQAGAVFIQPRVDVDRHDPAGSHESVDRGVGLAY